MRQMLGGELWVAALGFVEEEEEEEEEEEVRQGCKKLGVERGEGEGRAGTGRDAKLWLNREK